MMWSAGKPTRAAVLIATGVMTPQPRRKTQSSVGLLDLLPLRLLLFAGRRHRDLDVHEAVFLREHVHRLDRVAAVAGVVIERGDLYALQLVIAAKLLRDVIDDDRRLAPVIEQQREQIGKYAAVECVLAAARVVTMGTLSTRICPKRDVEAA